jgi:hypothetical protein
MTMLNQLSTPAALFDLNNYLGSDPRNLLISFRKWGKNRSHWPLNGRFSCQNCCTNGKLESRVTPWDESLVTAIAAQSPPPWPS